MIEFSLYVQVGDVLIQEDCFDSSSEYDNYFQILNNKKLVKRTKTKKRNFDISR